MTDAARHTHRYTYTDYLSWPDNTRWELLDGEAYAMVPAPTTRHQAIQQNLAGLLFNHFRGKSCRPFHAPIDVKLSDYDVVQPDLLVVCDPAAIGERAILGAPDLVVEITSPSTEARDRREKRALYERFGVKEYWLVSPNGFVEQYMLEPGAQYGSPSIVNIDENLRSNRFPELSLQVSEIFEGLIIERPEVREPGESV